MSSPERVVAAPAGGSRTGDAARREANRVTVRDRLARLRHRLRRALGLGPHHRVVYDANRAGERPGRRRALLVYLPRAFQLPDDDSSFLRHSNLRRCRAMAAVLGELGFVVDVANSRQLTFRPRLDYDLVVGEKLDWGRLENRFRADAVRVFLATSMDHVVHNANVRRRHARLVERGRAPVALRRIYPERMPAMASADALVGVGDQVTIGSWRRGFAGPLHTFDGFALRAGVEPEERRDFTRARRHFLFFASGGQVQKGLDLVLEVFARHPQLDLHVCSRFATEPDFCASYRRELDETPNVHTHGWTAVESPLFLELVRSCAWVVHPSCAEGQAGAVVHCLHSGLVPIVTRECGLDGVGVPLADDALETLERAVLEAAARPAEHCRAEADSMRRLARARFTEERFAERWRSILGDILAARSDGTASAIGSG